MCGNSKGLGQTAHQCSLIQVFAVPILAKHPLARQGLILYDTDKMIAVDTIMTELDMYQ